LSSVSKVYFLRWHPDGVDLDMQIHFSSKKIQIVLHMIDFFYCDVYSTELMISLAPLHRW